MCGQPEFDPLPTNWDPLACWLSKKSPLGNPDHRKVSVPLHTGYFFKQTADKRNETRSHNHPQRPQLIRTNRLVLKLPQSVNVAKHFYSYYKYTKWWQCMPAKAGVGSSPGPPIGEVPRGNYSISADKSNRFVLTELTSWRKCFYLKRFKWW